MFHSLEIAFYKQTWKLSLGGPCPWDSNDEVIANFILEIHVLSANITITKYLSYHILYIIVD